MGIANGGSTHGASFDQVLQDAQRLGYAGADPSADVDGYDARSKLAILGFSVRIASVPEPTFPNPMIPTLTSCI